jgi:signal transduction histidine kinase
MDMAPDDDNLPRGGAPPNPPPRDAARAVEARAQFNANDFLAIVSHDLHRPLTSILAAAALIRENASRSDAPGRVQRWADELLASAADMERLIQDLEADHLDDGQLRMSPSHLDVAEIAEHVTDVFAPLAADRSITLSRDIKGPLPLYADGVRLVQVLSNLLDNAIQFTPHGGCVRVRAASQGYNHVISVIDTGVGIPKAELTGIFTARRTRGPNDRPTWRLGLFSSRRIIEAQGGRIWAEGQPGVGSTFYFTLPSA